MPTLTTMTHTNAIASELHLVPPLYQALVNNRKNKIIPSYELEIRLNWAGSVDGEEAKGKVVLPYVSDENADEEPEVGRTRTKELPELLGKADCRGCLA